MRPNTPALMCSAGLVPTMSKTPKRAPTLEEALKKGFSELKIGEANLQPAPEDNAASVEPQPPEPAQPILYNQKFEAVEDRQEFVVAKPTNQAKPEEEANEVKTLVSKDVVSTIGDEFDVEW